MSGAGREALTPGRHAVALLQVAQLAEPGVLQDDGASLQSVLPHGVLALVPDLERPLVSFHSLVHVDVGELNKSKQTMFSEEHKDVTPYRTRSVTRCCGEVALKSHVYQTVVEHQRNKFNPVFAFDSVQ